MLLAITGLGFSELSEALGASADAMQAKLEDVAFQAVSQVRSAAQAKVPKRTFNLMRSIIAEPIEGGALVTVNALYGKFVEFGTGLYGPHQQRIVSKSGGPLVWTQGGETIFAMSTAGMHAKPFFNPAVDEMEATLGERLDTFLQSIINAIAGSTA
jgi:HK97 gp10 family phage protein